MEMYQKIAEYYDHIFPYKPAQKKYILSSGTRRRTYCDIGCGTGSLASNLTQQFSEIAAFDSSREMIIRAIDREAPGIDFFTGSMLKIEEYFWENHFDVISCFGNTIVHLESTGMIGSMFKQVKKILHPDGVFLGQIINYDHILDSHLNGLPTIDTPQISFTRTYHLNSEESLFDFDTELLIKKSGEKISNTTHLLPLRRNRLDNLLKDAGFNDISYYSDFNREDYREDALSLVFEARISSNDNSLQE